MCGVELDGDLGKSGCSNLDEIAPNVKLKLARSLSVYIFDGIGCLTGSTFMEDVFDLSKIFA